MRTASWGTAATAIVVTCAFGALAGCSGGSDSAAKSTTTSPSTPAASSSNTPASGSSTSANPTANGAAAAGVSNSDLSKAVATTKMSFKDPYSSGTVSVAMLPLQRRGKLLIMTVAFTPAIAAGSERDSATIFSVLSQHLFSPNLIDATNLKKYSVVTAGGSKLKSDEVAVSATSGQPMYAWAAFAAPQDDVSALDVQVADAVPRFTGVPIQ